MTAPRIVLDTNVLIASIGTRSPYRWIFDSIRNGRLGLCVSDMILFEYQDVIARKTTRSIAENVVNFITINPTTELIQTYFNFGMIASDPADNKFVDCAIAAGADHLVSNDRHFQILKRIDFPKVDIITVKEFEAAYRERLAPEQ